MISQLSQAYAGLKRLAFWSFYFYLSRSLDVQRLRVKSWIRLNNEQLLWVFFFFFNQINNSPTYTFSIGLKERGSKFTPEKSERKSKSGQG